MTSHPQNALKLCLLALALATTGCAQSLAQAKSGLLLEVMGADALVDSPTLTKAEVVQQLAGWMKQAHAAVDEKWVLVLPPKTPLDLSATVRFKFAPSGHPLKATLQTSSGVAEFDKSLLRAAQAATPPPFPSRQAYDYVEKQGVLSITFVR